jgi:hypothetical protein
VGAREGSADADADSEAPAEGVAAELPLSRALEGEP